MNKTHASLFVILALLSLPIQFVNVLNEVAALTLLRGADFLSLIGQSQREALSMVFLKLHGEAFGVAETLWGLGMFFFGLLVYRSGFLPRFLGVLLFAAGVGYLAQSLTPFLLPGYESVANRLQDITGTLGEPAIILWLLIMGAKDRPLDAPA